MSGSSETVPGDENLDSGYGLTVSLKRIHFLPILLQILIFHLIRQRLKHGADEIRELDVKTID